MSWSITVMTAVTRVRRSTSVAASGGTKTRSLMKLHKKKPHGVRSEERGGRGLLMKLVRTGSTASYSVDGRPVDFRWQMQPAFWNCKYHFRTDLPHGGSVPNFVRKCRWTLTTSLHENQDHGTIYVLRSSPFSSAVSWWKTVEPTRRK
jgi:hypothetical protein